MSRELAVFEDIQGPWTVWEQPIEGADYVLGGDTAQGQKDAQGREHQGDQCTAFIGRRVKGRGVIQVAEFADWIDPYTFGEIVASWGARYNNAILNVERNQGLGTLLAVESCGYPRERLYVPTQQASVMGGIEARVWLYTTQQIKKLLVDTAWDYMQRGMLTLRSALLVAEMDKVSKDEKNIPVLGGKDRTVAMLEAVYVDATTSAVLVEIVDKQARLSQIPQHVDRELWKKHLGIQEEDPSGPEGWGDVPEFEDSPVGA